jgi:hypothetical protein
MAGCGGMGWDGQLTSPMAQWSFSLKVAPSSPDISGPSHPALGLAPSSTWWGDSQVTYGALEQLGIEE